MEELKKNVYLTPYRWAVIPGERVYIVKAKGPRTESCGTPENNDIAPNKYSGFVVPFEYFI